MHSPCHHSFLSYWLPFQADPNNRDGYLCRCSPAYQGPSCEFPRDPCRGQHLCGRFRCRRDPASWKVGYTCLCEEEPGFRRFSGKLKGFEPQTEWLSTMMRNSCAKYVNWAWSYCKLFCLSLVPVLPLVISWTARSEELPARFSCGTDDLKYRHF